MIIKVSVENFKSFDEVSELNMIASNKIRMHQNHFNQIGNVSVLKNSVIYGANASGKSNLVDVFRFIQRTVIEGLPVNSSKDFCRNKATNESRISQFEIQFSKNGRVYAFGFSAHLASHVIDKEWLYLLKDESISSPMPIMLYEVESDRFPEIGDTSTFNEDELNRFKVYASDYSGNDQILFLTEMNRGKRYPSDSKLSFFEDVFRYIAESIVVLDPHTTYFDSEQFSDSTFFKQLSLMMKSFDTGIDSLTINDNVSLDELSRTTPPDMLKNLLMILKNQLLASQKSSIQVMWKVPDQLIIIKLSTDQDPVISTISIRHTSSSYDFEYKDESDGTKRLFDLIPLILTKRDEVIFVVDELERSLHPKLTEQFIKLFMASHENDNAQLVFSTHEDAILSQDLFRRDEIWFIERDNTGSSIVYSLDKFKERYDKKIGKAYLEGRYGAIPVFSSFDFDKEE